VNPTAPRRHRGASIDSTLDLTSPCFSSPDGTALDNLLPVISLGQKAAWTPAGLALYLSWCPFAGCIVTTPAVAGLAGIFSRD
jgi:hypothetical protein